MRKKHKLHNHWHLVKKTDSHIWGFVFTKTYDWDEQSGWQLIFGLGRLQHYTIRRTKKA